MRELMVILSGSRAAEYFVPGLCVEGSDLDFYCHTDLAIMVQFWLGGMGVQWDEFQPEEGPGVINPGLEDYTVSGFRVFYGTVESPSGIVYAVQLICGKNCLASTCIFDFHSTITQCFITGFAAVSLYDMYSSHKQAVHWKGNDTNVSRAQPTRLYATRNTLLLSNHAQGGEGPLVPAILAPNPETDPGKIPRKFKERNVDFVPYFSQGAIAHGGSSHDLGPYGGRYRTIGDNSVLKISFEPYLDSRSWRVPFLTYFNAMKYIAFYETPYKTVSVPSLLERLDFPFNRSALSEHDREWSGCNHLFDPIANQLAGTFIAAGGLFHGKIPRHRLYCGVEGCLHNSGMGWLSISALSAHHRSASPPHSGVDYRGGQGEGAEPNDAVEGGRVSVEQDFSVDQYLWQFAHRIPF
jgi:hypothetical protein